MLPSPSRDEARARLPDDAWAKPDTAITATDRVLDALTDIMKFETDPVFAKLAQRRFLDITDKETEHAA